MTDKFLDFPRAVGGDGRGLPAEQIVHVLRGTDQSHRTMCGIGGQELLWRITVFGASEHVVAGGWTICVACCRGASRQRKAGRVPPTSKPSRVQNQEMYWSFPPPEESERCAWWKARIRAGWRPNRRIATMGYDGASYFYGVYIWEYLNVIEPLLREVGATS